jgi:hypothetical protein
LELEELVAHEPHDETGLAHGRVAQQHQLEMARLSLRHPGGVFLIKLLVLFFSADSKNPQNPPFLSRLVRYAASLRLVGAKSWEWLVTGAWGPLATRLAAS